MKLFTRRPRKKAHIEIIPMIDVMLLLLVFYILSTITLNQERGIHVQLPSAQTGDHDEGKDQQLVVTVDKDGHLFLNKVPTTADHLADDITALAQSRPGGLAAIKSNPVVINADLSVQHRFVVQTMDTLRKLDILRFSIATEPGGR